VLRVALVAGLILLALAPASAQQPSGAPVLVVYHAWPDPEAGRPDADPFSSPDALPLPGLPAERLPATRADGVLDADPAPEGNPDSAVTQVRELQRLVDLRAATGSPATLDVDGALQPGALAVDVNVTAQEPLGLVEARVVLVEDGIPFDAGGGTQMLRHVARASAPAERANLSAVGASFGLHREIALPNGTDPARVGVVVALRVVDPSDPAREPGEVVQAASWTARQAGPTHQAEKAVLVERLTATWCEPCSPGDAAVSLLAARDAPAAQSAGARYLQPVGPWAAAGLAAGLGAFALLLRRRAA